MINTIELKDRIAKCEKILESDEKSQIFAALADAYRKSGDILKAKDVCEKGLIIHPNYSSARVVMAKILMSENSYEDAWDELKLAISASGRSRAIDLLEAEILIYRGYVDKARVILERLYKSDPDDEIVKNLMSMIGEVRTNLDKTSIIKTDVVMPEIVAADDRKPGRTLNEIVAILKVMPRVLGVVAVDKNGLVLNGRFDGNYSKEEIAALAKNIFDFSKAGTDTINLGTLNEMLIESEQAKLWIFNKLEYLLVIYARDDVSIGSLRLKIDELIAEIGN